MKWLRLVGAAFEPNLTVYCFVWYKVVWKRSDCYLQGGTKPLVNLIRLEEEMILKRTVTTVKYDRFRNIVPILSHFHCKLFL